jgi:hypothetical protein
MYVLMHAVPEASRARLPLEARVPAVGFISGRALYFGQCKYPTGRLYVRQTGSMQLHSPSRSCPSLTICMRLRARHGTSMSNA